MSFVFFVTENSLLKLGFKLKLRLKLKLHESEPYSKVALNKPPTKQEVISQ